MIADIVQIVGLPLFAEGAISPVDDIFRDGALAVPMTGLLEAWHWEFMPSFARETNPRDRISFHFLDACCCERILEMEAKFSRLGM